jgi:hypothetical protein
VGTAGRVLGKRDPVLEEDRPQAGAGKGRDRCRKLTEPKERKKWRGPGAEREEASGKGTKTEGRRKTG